MTTIIKLPVDKEVVCGRCKCTLAYQHRDMRYSSSGHGQDYQRFAFIVCPGCQNQQQVPYNF